MSTATEIRRGPGNEYPMRVVEFARRCAAHDYPVDQIRNALAKRGYRPSWSTVKRWVDEDYAEDDRARNRNGGIPGRGPKRLWQRRLERFERLRDAGLTYSSIAKMARLDFGLELDPNHVRCMLTGRLHPRSVRALLSGEPIPRGNPRHAERRPLEGT